jgi:hypothetical protein
MLTRKRRSMEIPEEQMRIQNSSVFWDITLCNLAKVSQRFGGTCCLHFQGQRIVQARNQYEAGSKQCKAWLILQSLRCMQHVSPNHRMTFNGLHSVTSWKVGFFITSAVRVSKPTNEN